MANRIVVGISDQKIASGSDVLVSYALGSCVGICLHDNVLKIAGLAHILLPASTNIIGDLNVFKFADTAIKELIKGMERYGSNRYRLAAKISGGANMFRSTGKSVGEKNVQAVKDELARLKIKIIAEDVGGNYGRTLEFDSSNGLLSIKTISKGILVI